MKAHFFHVQEMYLYLVGVSDSQEHIDGLNLLLDFVQHVDSDGLQQRLVCLDGKEAAGSCANPFMYVHDVGRTFGKGGRFFPNARNSGMDFNRWCRVHVWDDENHAKVRPESVFAQVFKDAQNLHNPRVSRAGREFLTKRLSLLSQQQERALFEVSRIGDIDKTHSIEDWVELFDKKVEEVSTGVNINYNCKKASKSNK